MVSSPRYSYAAINDLALSDTGHFVFLDAWSISLIGSLIAQDRPLYLWTNNQYPLNAIETDDLDAKISKAQGQVMKTMVGMIMPICTTDIPEGTLVCDGATYDRSDYPQLYDAIDPSFHVSSSSFNVPDLKDRFVVGVSLTKANYSTGGSFSHTQTAAEIATHTHTTQPHTHDNVPHTHVEGTALPSLSAALAGVPIPSAIAAVGVTGPSSVVILPSSVIVDPTGTPSPMDITPPYYALRYVMVAL